MKIIISAPRAGSTFYTNYYFQKNPHLKNITDIHQCQDFHISPKKTKNYNFNRFVNFHKNPHSEHLIKILALKSVDKNIFKYIRKENLPVTILKRKDIEMQILSFALVNTTKIINVFGKFVYLNLNQDENIISPRAKPKNILNTDNLYYPKPVAKYFITHAFNSIRRIKLLENYLNVEETLYYEDIINYSYTETDRMPRKIHNMTKEEIYNCFTNKDQVRGWINKYLHTYT